MNDQAQQPIKGMMDPHHLSYLLRLWRTEEPLGTNWRASLEVPESGRRIGFASLEQLFAFLMDASERGDQACGADGSSEE